MRASWDRTFLEMAFLVAKMRSSCLRRKAAAIIVKNNRVLSMGYNGSPEGEVNCSDVGECLRGESKSGENLDRCRAAGVHGEVNALINAARIGVPVEGSTIYCTHSPCRLCSAAIKNSGIKKVVFALLYEGYPEGPEWLKKVGIEVIEVSPLPLDPFLDIRPKGW